MMSALHKIIKVGRRSLYVTHIEYSYKSNQTVYSGYHPSKIAAYWLSVCIARPPEDHGFRTIAEVLGIGLPPQISITVTDHDKVEVIPFPVELTSTLPAQGKAKGTRYGQLERVNPSRISVMSDEQILEKAIQKAVDGGWEPLAYMKHATVQIDQWRLDGMVEVGILARDSGQMRWVRELEGIIFNHDFAKALWGDGKTVGQDENYKSDELDNDIVFSQELWQADDGLTFHGKLWQYHLQQMVVADDPIKYLGENL